MKNHLFFSQVQQVQQMFFMDEEQNPSWKMVVQKESWSFRIMMNTCATLSGIDDGVPCLNTPMTHPPMPQDATLVGAKELSTRKSTIINQALTHVIINIIGV